jgi:flagellar biosynthesis/type III secretory pathway chaperone
MSTARATATKPASLPDFAPRLAELLDACTLVYEDLARAIEEHRQGLREASPQRVQRAVERQQDLLRRVAQLDQIRRELVATTAPALPALAALRLDRVTLTDLSRAAPSSEREALVSKARALRELVAAVRDQTAGVKAATASLLAHMEGILRQVGRQLSHAGTYSSRGVVESPSGIVTAVDLGA